MIEIFIPKMGANIETVDIGKIYKNVGETIKKGEILFDIVTDKATFAIEADGDGTILLLDCKEGQTLNVLEIVGYIGNVGEQLPEKKIQQPIITQPAQKQDQEQQPNQLQQSNNQTTSANNQQTSSINIKATPAAKKLAKENNIELEKAFAQFQGIIKEEHVQEYINKTKAEKENNEKNCNIIKEEISSRKKVEIKHLTKSKEYLYSSVTIAIPTTKIKLKLQQFSQEQNIRLTMLEYIIAITSIAIEKYPKVNGYYAENHFALYKEKNIAIAMNPDKELLVPVIKNADTLNLQQLSTAMKELIMKAIKNQLTIQDMENATFTVTDLSSYGVIEFSPIINSNQSAILGICAEYDSWKNENNLPTHDPKMNLILAFDHRLIDGKYAAEFLQAIKKKLLE